MVGWAQRQIDGVLVLVVAACLKPWPWHLSGVLGAYVVFATLGRSNEKLAFRGCAGDGVLFTVCIGPALLTAIEQTGQSTWPGAPVSAEVLAVASVQALMDFAVSMNLVTHVLQIATFVFLGATVMGLPTETLGTFLFAQKLALRCCLSRDLWGRCFSSSEGLFWAQSTATLAAVLQLGYHTHFVAWSSSSLFTCALMVHAVIFLMLTALFARLLTKDGQRSWASCCASVTTLGLFIVWGISGACRWSTTTRGTPLQWFTRMILEDERHLQLALLQWPAILLLVIGAIQAAAQRSEVLTGKKTTQHERAVVKVLFRKAFHVLAILLFIPPILGGQVAFLSLAFAVAAILFVILEAFRVSQTPWIAHVLDSFVAQYLDSRENTGRGDLVVTHLYLLLGCALPIWLEPPLEQQIGIMLQSQLDKGQHVLRLTAGVLAVGVGDACAAAFGVRFGRVRWPQSHRTVEGSMAFVVGVLVAARILLHLSSYGSDSGEHKESGCWALFAALVCTTMLTSLLEVYTQSIDNLVLPLYFCFALRVFTHSAVG